MSSMGNTVTNPNSIVAITRLPGYPSANLSDPAVTPFRQHPLDSEDDFGFTSADH